MSKTTKTRTYPTTPAGYVDAIKQAKKRGEPSITFKLKKDSTGKPAKRRASA